jgi:hypothetical protein
LMMIHDRIELEPPTGSENSETGYELAARS